MVPQAGIGTEISEMRRGFGEYIEDGWNALDVLGLAVSLGGFCVRCLDPASPWGRSLYALSAPLLVSRILFFAQLLPFQGPMVQASVCAVFSQMLRLLAFENPMLGLLNVKSQQLGHRPFGNTHTKPRDYHTS